MPMYFLEIQFDLESVEVFKPLYLLIDTFELNSWNIPEIEFGRYTP